MPLSVPTTTPDTNLAALLFPGAGPGHPAAPTTEGSTPFAQLFPGLAPDSPIDAGVTQVEGANLLAGTVVPADAGAAVAAVAERWNTTPVLLPTGADAPDPAPLPACSNVVPDPLAAISDEGEAPAPPVPLQSPVTTSRRFLATRPMAPAVAPAGFLGAETPEAPLASTSDEPAGLAVRVRARITSRATPSVSSTPRPAGPAFTSPEFAAASPLAEPLLSTGVAVPPATPAVPAAVEPDAGVEADAAADTSPFNPPARLAGPRLAAVHLRATQIDAVAFSRAPAGTPLSSFEDGSASAATLSGLPAPRPAEADVATLRAVTLPDNGAATSDPVPDLLAGTVARRGAPQPIPTNVGLPPPLSTSNALPASTFEQVTASAAVPMQLASEMDAAAAAASLRPQIPEANPGASDLVTPPAMLPLVSSPAEADRSASPLPARSRGEKFAVRADKMFAEKSPAGVVAPKNFLSAVETEVTPHAPGVGIGVAKSSDAMPAATLLDRPVHATEFSPAVAAPGAPLESPLRSELSHANEAPATAHRAVEAVLTAVERFSTGDRHAVNLQFSVGGADLAVRVELRADEVRTTFRTDSAELRSALAHEWQAVHATASDRPVRLASPVITSNSSEGSAFAGFSGDGAPRQRDGGTAPGAREFFASVAARSRAALNAAVGAGEMAPTPRLAPLSTALHLHTLA